MRRIDWFGSLAGLGSLDHLVDRTTQLIFNLDFNFLSTYKSKNKVGQSDVYISVGFERVIRLQLNPRESRKVCNCNW